MSKDKIKRVDENGQVKTYPTIAHAAKDVESKLEYCKIELYISQAIQNRTRAFKSQWQALR